MKYLSLTLAMFAFTSCLTAASAEARQRIPETRVSQTHQREMITSKKTATSKHSLPAKAQDKEMLTTILEDIFTSVRDQNYSNLASFYSEEAQANFKYRFLKRDKISKLQQVIPEVIGRLETLPPADFINTVFTYMFDKLTLSLGLKNNPLLTAS